MTDLEFTSPVRCYNGAYDDESQRVLDAQDAALAKIRLTEPQARVTYLPMEGTYMVHSWGRPLSAEHSTRGSALSDALERVNSKEKTE